MFLTSHYLSEHERKFIIRIAPLIRVSSLPLILFRRMWRSCSDTPVYNFVPRNVTVSFANNMRTCRIVLLFRNRWPWITLLQHYLILFCCEKFLQIVRNKEMQKIVILYISLRSALGSVVVKHCAASRRVSGSIPSGVTGDFFRSYRRNHLPWGRLSL
jgi:hypothetical protein